MKTVFFLSGIHAPTVNATSTDIMTKNLIEGIKQNGDYVVFFALCRTQEDEPMVEQYYQKIVDRLIVLPRFYGKKTSKYWHGC